MRTLRPLDVARDAAALHAVYGDTQSCTYLSHEAFDSVAETRVQLETWTAGLEALSWAVIDPPDGEALGRVALVPVRPEVFEVAVMLVPAAAGRGLAFRAMGEALDHAFDALGARRVEADIDPDNRASVSLFTRLGFASEGRLRAAWRTHLGVRDTLLMGLLAADPRPWHRARPT
ncbi:MAG: GNAT family protein [Myxococcota bacterium]